MWWFITFFPTYSFIPLTLTLTFLVPPDWLFVALCDTLWWSHHFLLHLLFSPSNPNSNLLGFPSDWLFGIPTLEHSGCFGFPPGLSRSLSDSSYLSSFLPLPISFPSMAVLTPLFPPVPSPFTPPTDISPARTGCLSSPTSHPLIISDFPYYYNWRIQSHWCTIYIPLICYWIVFLIILFFPLTSIVHLLTLID